MAGVEGDGRGTGGGDGRGFLLSTPLIGKMIT